MTEEEFLQTMDEILFTNVDVSAGVLATLFTNLASHRSVQDNLRREVAARRSEPGFDLAKYLAKADSLLNQTIMESMRHSPAFCKYKPLICCLSDRPLAVTSADSTTGFSMPETTACPKLVGGYKIPANTSVVIDTRRLNNEAVTWGEDGASFRPERFAEVPRQKQRHGFMRFGVGAASGRCLGKNIADVVFKLTTMMVLETFTLGASADKDEVCLIRI
jgi:cytochrome P450 monooxygenase